MTAMMVTSMMNGRMGAAGSRLQHEQGVPACSAPARTTSMARPQARSHAGERCQLALLPAGHQPQQQRRAATDPRGGFREVSRGFVDFQVAESVWDSSVSSTRHLRTPGSPVLLCVDTASPLAAAHLLSAAARRLFASVSRVFLLLSLCLSRSKSVAVSSCHCLLPASLCAVLSEMEKSRPSPHDAPVLKMAEMKIKAEEKEVRSTPHTGHSPSPSSSPPHASSPSPRCVSLLLRQEPGTRCLLLLTSRR